MSCKENKLNFSLSKLFQISYTFFFLSSSSYPNTNSKGGKSKFSFLSLTELLGHLLHFEDFWMRKLVLFIILCVHITKESQMGRRVQMTIKIVSCILRFFTSQNIHPPIAPLIPSLCKNHVHFVILLSISLSWIRKQRSLLVKEQHTSNLDRSKGSH